MLHSKLSQEKKIHKKGYIEVRDCDYEDFNCNKTIFYDDDIDEVLANELEEYRDS